MNAYVPRRAFLLALVASAFASFAHAQILPSDAQAIVGLRVLSAREARAADGTPGLDLAFDPDSAAKLREFSSRVVGRRVMIYVDGRLAAVLVVKEPITGSGIMLTGNVEPETREQLLRGTPSIVDLRAE
jgi:preprotein translocase subunit SecD